MYVKSLQDKKNNLIDEFIMSNALKVFKDSSQRDKDDLDFHVYCFFQDKTMLYNVYWQQV